MSQINSVRVKNLRCFADTGFIDLRPITILVGKNSAGKSTFARLFPLLRQSAEEDKRSPILWYGRLVDFGSFPVAINRTAREKRISLGFKIVLKSPKVKQRTAAQPWSIRNQSRVIESEEIPLTIEINLDYSEKSKTTYASSIKLNLFDNECIVSLNDANKLTEIIINDYRWQPNEINSCDISQKNILPSLTYLRLIRRKVDDKELSYRLQFSPFIQLLVNKLKVSVSANTSFEKLINLAGSIKLGNNEVIVSSLLNSPFCTAAARKKFTTLCNNKDYIETIKCYVFADALPDLFEMIDESLSEFLSGVRYVEPLRATAQRYYRGQDLAVDEIDSKGANVAMYIDSLTISEKDRLNLWLEKYFGVEIHSKGEGGHVALILKSKLAKVGTNIADLGVGFSQMLPIILQLWQASHQSNTKKRSRVHTNDTCIVIEQPELHLHPAYQAKIADVMVASIKEARDSNRTSQIIAETHSPHLINRLGELIAEKIFSPNDVQVVVFQDSETGENSEISTAVFDENGMLNNWPYGFFEP